jgi:hypothetical protein
MPKLKTKDTAGSPPPYKPERELPMPKYQYQKPDPRSGSATNGDKKPSVEDREVPSLKNLDLG